MNYKFDFSFLAERWPDFLAGAWLTIQLTVVSIALGFAAGHGLRDRARLRRAWYCVG